MFRNTLAPTKIFERLSLQPFVGGLAAASFAAAMTAPIVLGSKAQFPVLVTLAVGVSCVLLLQPAAFLIIIAACEQFPGGSGLLSALPWFDRIGSSLYNVHKFGIPLISGLAVLTILISVIRLTRSKPTQARMSLISWTLLIVGFAMAYFAYGSGSAILGPTSNSVLTGVRAVLPWAMLLAGFLAVLTIGKQHITRANVAVALKGFLIFKGMLAIATWIDGSGATIDGVGGLVVFGPVSPWVASAFLSSLFVGKRVLSRSEMLAGAASVVILIGAGRITFFVALTTAIIAVGVLNPRLLQWRRLFLYLITPIVLFGALPIRPSRDLRSRFETLLPFFKDSGVKTLTSASLHVDDVKLGASLALENPLTGIGVEAAQPKSFANSASATLYVHNEFLQQWLRFGILGLTATITLVGLCVWYGFRSLAANDGDRPMSSLGLMLVTTPVALLTAPFFSAEQRYPVILGACLAVVVALNHTKNEESYSVSQDLSALKRGVRQWLTLDTPERILRNPAINHSKGTSRAELN